MVKIIERVTCMELNEWFEKGLTPKDYISQMTVNKEELQAIYEKFSLTDTEKDRLAPLKDMNLKVIVLTEDWCGDALLNNPVLLKIAEETNMDVRFLLCDQNLELMDQYLTNGTSRSIPIFIFLNEIGEEQAVWGPRANSIQEMVDVERSKLPSKEDPEFQEKQKALFKKFKTAYQQKSDLWHVVAESIINTIRKISID